LLSLKSKEIFLKKDMVKIVVGGGNSLDLENAINYMGGDKDF